MIKEVSVLNDNNQLDTVEEAALVADKASLFKQDKNEADICVFISPL